VSGSLGQGEELQRKAAGITFKILEPLKGRELTWREASDMLGCMSCESSALPLLCAVESAVLACVAQESASDPYSVLQREPVRSTVVYGGVLPFLPLEMARVFVRQCARMKLTNLKVKVGSDAAYNNSILGLCREVLGGEFDIRVDANSSWTVATAGAQLEICARHGVRMIEQPFPAGSGFEADVRLTGEGFAIMADEGVLNSEDVRNLASSGSARVLNLRLSKNGGLSRVLALAAEAESYGMSYQLGCMVGETGILSCLGRLTASLLPNPIYVEGSYDEILLAENITLPSFGFGSGGEAPVVRAAGMGYRIDEARLGKFTRARLPV
jgi:muconate cycloisomerase